MNSPALGLRVAAIIFGLVCLAQLSRLLLKVEIVVGSHPVPLWPSGIAVLVTGALCLWLWRLSISHKPDAPRGPAAA